MAKGVLVFKLPDEREEFELAQQAGALHSALGEIREFVRIKIKHGDLNEEQYQICQELFDKIIEETEGLLS